MKQNGESTVTLNITITTMLHFAMTATESYRANGEWRNGQSYVSNTSNTVTIAENDYGKSKMWLCLAL